MPARTPMPAPQLLESPAVRRSAMLAKLLEEQRRPVDIRGGYGELGARLLAQGITQWGATRAERAAQGERKAALSSQRDALLASLGGNATPEPAVAPAPDATALASALSPPPVTNTQIPQEAAIAPAAPIQGAPLPPAGPTSLEDALLSGPMPQSPPAAPMPAAPQAMPAAPAPAQNPRGPTPEEIALIRQAASSGDPGQLAWAQQTWGEIQMRMATPPEINIAVGPDGTPYNTNDPESLNRRFRNVENINGFLRDVNDPNNVNRYIPDLQPGEEPVYDQSGNVVGVRNLAGAIDALGQRERATQDAGNASRASYAGVIAGNEAAARAPYQFVNVQSPTGAPTTMSAASAAGGVFQGQTPADAIREEGTARNDVAAIESARVRSSAANRLLPELAQMEQLLPDVIAGFGSDITLTAQRALAAAGNEDATRRVTATQTFQNLARQTVASILPLFGANPTEGERKYAEQMSGADVSYTPESLQEGIRLARDRARREREAYEGMRGGDGGPARPQSRAEFDALPSGTTFIAPDGTTRRKP
jgi:hypothetical protein